MAGVRIQLRRDTAANWTSANPILRSGEMGIETDTDKIKVGDGGSHWNSLDYRFGSSTTTNNNTYTVTGGNMAAASGFANVDAIITHFGTSDLPVFMDSDVTVSASKTFPSNANIVHGGGKFVKSSSGAIEFQGVGVANPESQDALFSGFGAGDITWTGTDYPKKLSLNLWDQGSSVTARIERGTAAMSGKKCTLVAYEGNIDSGPTTLKSGHSLYLTQGTYTDTWDGGANPAQRRFFLEDNTSVFGDGRGKTIYQCSSLLGNNFIFFGSGLNPAVYAGQDGPNENIAIGFFTIQADQYKINTDNGGSAIGLGNVTNGIVTGMHLKNLTSYGIYCGGFGSLGYHAKNVMIRDNIFDYVRGQNTGSINGENITVTGNHFVNVQAGYIVRTIASVTKTGGSDAIVAAAGTGAFTSGDVGRRIQILNGSTITVDTTISSIISTDAVLVALVRSIASVSKTAGTDTITAAAGTGNFTSDDVGRTFFVLSGTTEVVAATIAAVINTDTITVSGYTVGSTATALSAQLMGIRNPGNYSVGGSATAAAAKSMRVRNYDGFIALMDFEPNSPSDTIENISIYGNTLDCRNAVGNHNLIIVQSAGNNTGTNGVVIANNILRGENGVSSNGIVSSFGSNHLIANNVIENIAQQGISISGIGHSLVTSNYLRSCGAASNPIYVSASALVHFDGNIIDSWSDAGGGNVGSADIFEAEVSGITVNTSSTGNTVTRTAGPAFPQQWWVGRTVTINGVDRVVASVVDYITFTLTTDPGNHTGVTMATKFSDNRYSNNKRSSITLLGTSVEYSRMDVVAATQADITNVQTQITELSVDKLNATDLLRGYQASNAVYNNTAALANTNLSVNVQSGSYYKVEAIVHGSNAVKALLLDFGGTATILSCIGEWTSHKATGAFAAGDNVRVTNAGTDYSNAGLDTFDGFYKFEGQIRVGVGGTFVLRAAQRTADVSNTTLLADSNIVLTRVFTAPFDPSQVAGLYQWLDAGTLGLADNDPVGTWTDVSGNTRNATQATGANKPTFKTSIVNSLPIVRFDGTNDRLGLGDFSALTQGEGFIVVKVDNEPAADGNHSGLWNIGSDAVSGHYSYFGDGHIYESFGTTARKDTGNPTPALTSWHIYSVYSATSDWKNFIDGVQLFSTTTNTAGFSSSASLGCDSGASNFLDGDVAEFIMFSNKLSTTDRANVVAYLKAKYAIA